MKVALNDENETSRRQVADRALIGLDDDARAAVAQLRAGGAVRQIIIDGDEITAAVVTDAAVVRVVVNIDEQANGPGPWCSCSAVRRLCVHAAAVLDSWGDGEGDIYVPVAQTQPAPTDTAVVATEGNWDEWLWNDDAETVDASGIEDDDATDDDDDRQFSPIEEARGEEPHTEEAHTEEPHTEEAHTEEAHTVEAESANVRAGQPHDDVLNAAQEQMPASEPAPDVPEQEGGADAAQTEDPQDDRPAMETDDLGTHDDEAGVGGHTEDGGHEDNSGTSSGEPDPLIASRGWLLPPKDYTWIRSAFLAVSADDWPRLYRTLAFCLHPDRRGGDEQAMHMLTQVWEQVSGKLPAE